MKRNEVQSKKLSLILFCFIGNYVAFPIKQKALRVDRTAAKRNLSLRDPPQAENPALQDSIFIVCILENLAERRMVLVWKMLFCLLSKRAAA